MSLKKTKLFVKYYWAAAALLAVISITYLVLTLRGKEEPQPQIVNISKDIKAPDKNNAFITLANGTILYLDSTGNGSLAQQGNIQLVKLANGQIVYKTTDGEILKEIQYNTLNNPRGSQVINMQLSDGTHVWLNAGSSVTYPVAFAGRERKVSITGEAYFEVAHDNTKPFYVNKGTMEVEVLGTHFNVNAYDDEENVRVTLLEGSVKVMSNSNPESASGVQQAKILKPGEQARVNLKPVRTAGGAEMINLELADLDEVMAWKNGKFDFGEGVDIETLMRQIARWYDVEVVYKEKPGKLFRGRIPREMSAANVFRALEETGGVYFSIDGKKVTVMK